MLLATTLPQSMARTTVEGPKKQSPPVKTRHARDGPGGVRHDPPAVGLHAAALKVGRVNGLSHSGDHHVAGKRDLRLIGRDRPGPAALYGAAELRLDHQGPPRALPVRPPVQGPEGT